MIRPLNTTQLSSAKPRSGLQSISDLLPKLIEMYEIQSKARSQIQEDKLRRRNHRTKKSSQATFAWYR